jgi:hypothetical protein
LAGTGSHTQKAAEDAARIEARAIGLDLPHTVRPQHATHREIAHRVEGEIREEVLDRPVVGPEGNPAINADRVAIEPEVLQHDVAVTTLADIELELSALTRGLRPRKIAELEFGAGQIRGNADDVTIVFARTHGEIDIHVTADEIAELDAELSALAVAKPRLQAKALRVGRRAGEGIAPSDPGEDTRIEAPDTL